ncbi:MAG TPA: metallophosphoesterase, partial [Chitinophagaceae bacterium]|nr:metallophosphoesterase [Chitinophagaceae bacterium]
MKIAILHLSDIHLKSASTNIVLKRRDKIFDAIKNRLLTVDETFLIITGDVAFSGLKDEYALGQSLLEYLCENIKSYTKKSCRIIAIPGNHDCYFVDSKESARERILKGLEQEQYANVDEYSLDLCTEPQENYFSFISDNGYNRGDELLHDHKLLTSIKFVRGDFSVIFHCYNTSWHSRKNELQGRMSLPVKQFDRKAFRHNANVIISLIHHPFNWQNAGSGRDARIHLENTSDFVLSGHEHAKGKYIRKSDSETTYYIESGTLQDSVNAAISEFGLMMIDLEKKEFCFDNYELSNGGDRYINVSNRGMEPLLRSKQLTAKEFEVTDRFYNNFLQDPGSKFLHSQTDKIKLSDIFVYPNLRRVYDVRDVQPKEVEAVSGDVVMENLDEEKLRVILVGDDGAGKTTFCKYMYTYFWHQGYVPVYLNCNDVNVKASTDNFVRKVNAHLCEQYENMKEEIASQIDRQKIVVILEDFELLKGSSEAKAKFVHGINKVFIHIVITGKAQLLFEPITTTNKVFVDAYKDYMQFHITEFGRDLRYKLIDKWNKIGRVDEVEPNEIRRMNDATMAKMDSIIGKNFLPPYPIYLLTIIQSLESVAAANPDYSLQGYYYDYLISDSMNKAISDKESLSFYYNFVSEYAYFLFSEKIRTQPMSRDSFEKLYNDYKEKYQINVNVDSVIENLMKAKIIVDDENKNISLAYNYIYYFFIARYLSSRIHLEEIKTQIKYMCAKMYREEYANVILFLVHLSKDPLILNEIQQVASSLFVGMPICRLENDVDRIDGMIENMPKQVIELIDVDKAREMEFENQEQMEAE